MNSRMSRRTKRSSSSSVTSAGSYGSRSSSKGLLKKNAIGRIFSGRASDLSRAIMTENWSMVVTIVENHPQLTKVWTKCPGFFDGHKESSLLPIHQACSFHAPLYVLEALIQAHPTCLNERETGYDRLPVHIACHSSVGFDVLKLLVADYPESAGIKDMVGRIPLHYACSNGASLDIVRLLVNASPESVRMSDFNGWIPLHVACRVGTSTEVIKFLLQTYPESANQPTFKSNYPKSLANMEDGPNRDEIIKLLDLFINRPDLATTNKNNKGKGLCNRSGRQRIFQEQQNSNNNIPNHYHNNTSNSKGSQFTPRNGISSRRSGSAQQVSDPYDSATSVEDKRGSVSNTSSSSRFKYIRAKSKRIAHPIKKCVRNASSKTRRNKKSSSKSGFDMEKLLDATDIC